MLMKYIDTLPRKLLMVIGCLMVAGMGYIDWKTGDYSMLIFYTIPIFAVSWSAGRWCGIFICLVAGCARFVAEIPLHNYSFMNYWNSFVDTTFFIIVSLLVSQLRKQLD